MKTQLLAVTPAQARKWLEQNTDNRRLRPMVVEGLRAAWDRGEWKTTHQGVAFSTSGRLLDGQHRLTFISQLPDDEIVMMNVTTGMDDATFMVIDKGVGRSTADTLGKSTKLVAVGKLLARVHNASQASGLTDALVAPFIELVEPLHTELTDFCPTFVKIWSAAPVQAAAVYRMIVGEDADFVKATYRALVVADFQAMSPIAQSLYKQHVSGVVMSARSLDLFVRSLKVFDAKKAGATRIQINDMSATLLEVRTTLGLMIEAKKNPTVAGSKVAKPKLNSTAERNKSASFVI
jgi:hypothetical protein